MQVSSFSFLRNQISKLFPGPFLGKAFGGIFEGADVGVCVEPQAKMPSLILDKFHQISGMERPVSYDYNLRVLRKQACKRSEQGYLLSGIGHSFPSIRLPTDRQCPPAICNPSHKHLPFSRQLQGIDENPKGTRSLGLRSLNRKINQAISHWTVEPFRIDILVSKKPSQMTRLALKSGSSSNPAGHLREVNMLGQVQSGDHLRQGPTPRDQGVGQQLGKRRLHLTLYPEAVAHRQSGTRGSVIGSPQRRRSSGRGQRPSCVLAGVRKTVR
ncbi:hypothetical protein GGQ06_002738 [Salinibacter ruber]|nr:hypothetical protein [Salinibacter ruber]MCS4054133.1 hypothetical protein [Salinibacter ruber]